MNNGFESNESSYTEAGNMKCVVTRERIICFKYFR